MWWLQLPLHFQEHDELVQGLLLLRDYYKAEYKKALQDKVDQQRKSQQQRKLKHDEEIKAAEHQQVQLYMYIRLSTCGSNSIWC